MDNVKVVIWGFGAMGSGMARMLLKKKGVEIVGVCCLAPERVGRDMYEYIGIEREGRMPVTIKSDIKEVISEKCCDVAIIATDSFVKTSFEKIKFCVQNKLNVISTAEEMAFPKAQNPELAEEIDRLAKDNGVTVLGTGINPGFVLDYLILALTGTCETVDYIKATRVNDLSPFGKAVMEEQGVGFTLDQYSEGIKNNKIAGHVGFPESISMIAEGLGLEIQKVEQTKEPIISNTRRKTQYAEVEPGNLAGIRQRAKGYINDKVMIEMDHPQQVLPHLESVNTGDYIEIKGVPNINLKIQPEIPGGIGTISMCVNMIPHVVNAEPGLATMLDLPVPRAIMGDMRKMLKKWKKEN